MVGWGVGETPWFFSASALMPALWDLTLMSESGLAFVGVGCEVGLAPLASSWLARSAAAAAEVDGDVGLASLR